MIRFLFKFLAPDFLFPSIKMHTLQNIHSISLYINKWTWTWKRIADITCLSLACFITISDKAYGCSVMLCEWDDETEVKEGAHNLSGAKPQIYSLVILESDVFQESTEQLSGLSFYRLYRRWVTALDPQKCCNHYDLHTHLWLQWPNPFLIFLFLFFSWSHFLHPKLSQATTWAKNRSSSPHIEPLKDHSWSWLKARQG